MADGHKFSAVRRLSSRLLERSKSAFYLPRPSEFLINILRRKTKVPGASCGVVFEILHLAILVEERLVTDGQTNGQTGTRG